MAKQVVTTTTYVDDLDGSGNAETVTFSFAGTDYTIALGKKNRAAFERALRPYLQAAVKVSRRGSSRRSASRSSDARNDYAAVREWAKGQGLEVSDRGRVPRAVIEQYDAAH